MSYGDLGSYKYKLECVTQPWSPITFLDLVIDRQIFGFHISFSRFVFFWDTVQCITYFRPHVPKMTMYEILTLQTLRYGNATSNTATQIKLATKKPSTMCDAMCPGVDDMSATAVCGGRDGSISVWQMWGPRYKSWWLATWWLLILYDHIMQCTLLSWEDKLVCRDWHDSRV